MGGTPIADFLHGGPYSGLSTQLLVTHAYGGALQFSDDARAWRVTSIISSRA